MTESGVRRLIKRLIGTYPQEFIMSDDKQILVMDNLARNFRDYEDDQVDDALTAYINSDTKNKPPGSGQLKAIINQTIVKTNAEIDYDRTRLVEDEEGRLWYNESYSLVESQIDPNRKVLKPNHDRPFDGKNGYTAVRVPRSNEELVAVCKKHGFEYTETKPMRINGPEGLTMQKTYVFSDELHNWVENDRFRAQLR